MAEPDEDDRRFKDAWGLTDEEVAWVKDQCRIAEVAYPPWDTTDVHLIRSTRRSGANLWLTDPAAVEQIARIMRPID